MALTFSAIATKVLEQAGPISTFIRGKMEKNLSLHRALQEFGLGSDQNDDHDIYFKALSKYEDAGAHPEFVKILSENQLEQFFMEAYKQTLPMGRLSEHVMAALFANGQLEKFEMVVDQEISTLMGFIILEAFNSLPPGLSLILQVAEETRKSSTESNSMIKELHGLFMGDKEKSFADILPLATNEETKLSQNDFDESIEDIIDLLDQGLHKAAIISLEKFRDRKAADLSAEQYFKIDANIGLAAFELDDFKKSSKFLTMLASHLPESAAAQGLTAIGFAIDEDYVKARDHIEIAEKIDNQVSFVKVAGLLCLETNPNIDKYLEWEKGAYLKDSMIGLGAASFLIRHLPNASQRAVDILNNIDVNKGTKAYYIKAELKAVATTWPISEFVKSSGGYLPEDWKKLLSDAISNFTIAWEFYKNSDVKTAKWHVLANRGVAYKLLDDDINAEKDLLESIFVKPNYFQYRQLLTLRHMQNRDNTVLIEEAGRIAKTEEEKEELFFMYLTELEIKDAHQKILEIIEAKKLEGTTYDSIAIAFFEVRANMALGKVEAACKYAEEITNENPDKPLASYIAALAALKVKDFVAANYHLNNAFMHSDNSTPDGLKLNIVSTAYDLRMYRAIEIFLSKAPYTNYYSDFSKFLIKALMAESKTEEAEKVIVPLIAQMPNDPVLLSVSMGTHERKMELKEALQIAEKFPNDSYFLGKKIAYLFSLDSSKAMRCLAKLIDEKNSENKFSVREKFISLIVAAKSANPDGISFLQEEALKLRNAHVGAIETHYGYHEFVTTIHNSGHYDEVLKVVVENSIVQFSDKAENQKEFIIGDDVYFKDPIRLNSDLGKSLIGKQVSDVVEIEGVQWKIKGIGGTYYAAYADSTLRVIEADNNGE